MGLTRLSLRIGRACTSALLAAGCLWAGADAAPRADAAADAISDLDAARDLGGRDPNAAHAVLARLREDAIARGRTALRLAIDEADCRLLSDLDASRALRVAEAGLANSANDVDTQVAALRLRACAAGVQFDVGHADDGVAALEQIVAEARRSPDLKAGEAMALLERGLHRSRRGELLPGQADLLDACGTLESLGLRRDLELCHWHLANHYKRMGDVDEALRLLEPLLEAARRRQATIDVSVYVLGIAQARFEQRAWEPALRAFEESSAISQAAGDSSGIAYAEYGIGNTLLRMGRFDDALPHAERSREALASAPDPSQSARTTLLHATLLAGLKRPLDALAELQAGQAGMESMRDRLIEAAWLQARAATEAQLGRWEHAYASLEAARRLEQQLHEQRLSQQSARLRMQFNRERDAAELRSLRHVNEQGARLQHTQALALALFVMLLGAAVWVAARKLRESRQLRRLAMVDELTGLPNRRAVLDRLDAELQRARRAGHALSVLVVDVDHFKAVNDTHGHGVGDEVLRHLARLLAASLRANDRIGRLGGEEFLVVLPEAGAEHSHLIAERMRLLVEASPCPTSAGTLALTISIGAACLEGELPESPAALIERADTALYDAKTFGRNRVCAAAAPVPQPA